METLVVSNIGPLAVQLTAPSSKKCNLALYLTMPKGQILWDIITMKYSACFAAGGYFGPWCIVFLSAAKCAVLFFTGLKVWLG